MSDLHNPEDPAPPVEPRDDADRQLPLAEEAEHAYQVQLPEFEGPLDLLLHLVKRHELDIINIPIAFITQKYLAYLDLMRALNIDVAGEYLLMASTLAYIKSRELLPRRPEEAPEDDDDDGADPKEELIRRLLEYQRYKEAAAKLSERPTLGHSVFGRGAPAERIDKKDVPLAEVGTFELLSALNDVMQRSKAKLTYDVLVDRISLGDRINELVDLLQTKPTLSFVDCLLRDGSREQARHHLVVSFLAILEMARLKMIRILQEAQSGSIYLTRRDTLQIVEQGVDGGADEGEGAAPAQVPPGEQETE